ncbi:MAG: hypothetical protein M3Y27_22040 [Acidobacteriota bacterium]|nr:hypothetical protein [Acidobacteriota bacterium]
MLRVVAAVLVISTGIAAQTKSPVVREGADWIQIVSGSLPIAPHARLRVTTIGNITLLAGGPNTLLYSLKKKVRASSQAAAESAFQNLQLKTVERGGWMWLTVSASQSPRYSAELVITAPRELAQARLDTRDGAILANGFDGEIAAETGGGRIELDELRSNATAKTGGGEIQAGRVGGHLRAYTGGGAIRVNSAGQECWLDTAGGDIFVREASAPVHAATAGGSIRVDRCAKEVYAKTAAGVIEVGKAGGVVTAETSGGAIQVNGARGVRCESSSGTIRLRNMQGAMRAETTHGSILAQLQAGQRIEDSLLSTLLGDITVLLSSNTPVTIQARNESAGSKRRIISEFREIRIRNADWESNEPVVAEGALSGGGPVLRIVTSSGIIYLRRQ